MQIYTPEQRKSIILESELYVLRAMCQGARDRRVYDEGMTILANYPFTDQTHQLIYDALRELNTDQPDIIRALLPRRLANKGFPDIDVQDYFKPHNLASEAVISMMEGVQFSARGRVRFPVQ